MPSLTVNRLLATRTHMAYKSGGSVCQSVDQLYDTAYYWPDDPLIAEPTARIKPRKP